MQKHKKIHLLLTAVLVAIFTIGSVGVGIFASRITNDFSASVITVKKKIKKKKRSAATKMLQDLAIMPSAPEDSAALCAYTPPENPEYKGEFTLKNTKITAGKGEEFTVALYLKNTGNTTWFGDRSGCESLSKMRLGTAKERDRNSIFFNPGEPLWINPNRIAMVEQRVEPGEIATFKITSRGPNVSDIFREYWEPVVEGVKWFEEKESRASVDIYVGETTAENERTVFYLGKTGQASELDPNGEISIDIDISDQRMKIFLGSTIIREFMISSGTFNTPTPTGTGRIVDKQDLRIANKYPHYRMPFWHSLAFDKHGGQPLGFGFHSLPYLANDKGIFWNEALNHIGQRVSHGCVRVLPENAEDLYNITQIGTKFLIHD